MKNIKMKKISLKNILKKTFKKKTKKTIKKSLKKVPKKNILKTALFEAEINEALKDGFISDDEAKKIEELRKQLNLSEEHSKSLIGLLSEKNKE